MADSDVKVKFSGDFSDIGKGASEAAQKAGTALQGQVAKLGEELVSRIGAAFALTALVDKFAEKLSEAHSYFNELNDAIDKFGGGGEEFQRVAGLAKSVSVPMEVVAKSMGIFSKYIGVASKDVEGHGKVLRELGFTNEQITAGNISATEVLAALSKQLKQTGNDNLVAANATIVFGRAGAELLPIIQKGESAIREQAGALKVYSDAELQAAEAAERAAARRQAAWAKFFRWLALQVDEAETKNIVGDTIVATTTELQQKGVKVNTPEGQAQLNQEIIKRLSAQGVGLEAQQVGALSYLRQQVSTPGLPSATRDALTSEINKLVEQMKETSKGEKETRAANVSTSTGGNADLSTSSLQAIGGGDISSVLSGTIQVSMLTAMQETAANTGKLASGAENATNAQPKPNVAK